MWDSEKLWSDFSAVFALFREDIPRQLPGYSQQLVERDITTLSRRLAHEGESFLTKTLPTLGKAIDLALQGHTPLYVTSFKKRGRSALPVFLSGLLKRVFNGMGWVRNDPCLTSIRLLRQICFWCKKLERGYTDETLQKTIDDFIQVDDSLPSTIPNNGTDPRLLGRARGVCHRLFGKFQTASIRAPQHGPGSVADTSDPRVKRDLSTSYIELEAVFRPIPWFRSLSEASVDVGTILDRRRQQFGISRTEFVPKDSSGPRTIGLEPAEYMWCQKALQKALYYYIETLSLARGRINFTDQTINQKMVLDPERWLTLDMSKASDRCSYALVEFLFEGLELWPYLRASRTPATQLPSGEILKYKKFAPMGSAVCFPVEAVVFYCLAVAAQVEAGMPMLVAIRNTYVYGDDLIVLNAGQFTALQSAFDSVGLKFNLDKCCIHGLFRESCGLDAYAGEVVTPVRMRTSDVDDLSSVFRQVEHVNMLEKAGYQGAADTLRQKLTPILKKFGVKLQYSSRDDLPIASWFSYTKDTVRYKTDINTSLTYVSGWTWVPRKISVAIGSSEERYLRESLSRGGPVGELIWVDDKKKILVGPPRKGKLLHPRTQVRTLALARKGDYKFRRKCVVRERAST